MIGEEGKYVSVSPQRFVAAAFVPPVPGTSDAMDAEAELKADGSGFTVDIIGAPQEQVDVIVVVPKGGLAVPPLSQPSQRRQPAATELALALEGTVQVVQVSIGAAGRVRMDCRDVHGGCVVTA